MSEFAPVKEEEKKLAAGGEDAEGEDGGDDGPAPEEECAATFAPVVKLEAIEVKTHEEDEDVLYSECVSSCFCRNPGTKSHISLSNSVSINRRAKLFTYSEAMLDRGTGVKQWNEKGVGDVKLLKCVKTRFMATPAL